MMARNAQGQSTPGALATRLGGMWAHTPRGSARGDRLARARRRRRRQRGQTIVIFALSVTVLLGMGGLAIDVMRLFDLYARAERAAEAGALAGVIYLPCFYNNSLAVASPSCAAGSASPDGNTAIGRAMQEVYRNGFGTGSGGSACVGQDPTQPVAVCQVSGKATDLRVTITQTASVYLLSGVGVGATTISASAQSEYLPPIQMGSRYAYFGDQADCGSTWCDPNGGGTHVQNFRAVINGPADLKEFGDPYVYCEEGPSQLTSSFTKDSGNNPVYNGLTSNHPQYSPTADPRTTGHCGVPSSTNTGNPDQQPTGYNGPMTAGTTHPGAHNYAISVDTANSSIWVYNPNYIPTDLGGSAIPALPGNGPDHIWGLDHFQSTGQTLFGALTIKQNGGNPVFDDPSFYFNTTYSVYSAPVAYLRGQDVVKAQKTFQPYDMMRNDLALHGCRTDGTQVYDLTGTSDYPGTPSTNPANCVAIGSINSSMTPQAPCYEEWCLIYTAPSTGTYRLAVETTGLTGTQQNNISGGYTTLGWGSKQYAIRVCAPTSSPAGPNAPSLATCTAGSNTTVAAWNNMTVFYASSQASANFDLAYIPQTYAGRSIVVSIFDPGDSSGDVYMEIVPPSGSGVTVQYPSPIRTATDPVNLQTAIWASSNDRAYNGLWLNTTVTLPANYTQGWWQVYYDVPNGTPNDTVTISFSLIGSPIHLVPLG